MIVREELHAQGLDARLFPVTRLAAHAIKIARFETMFGGRYRTKLHGCAVGAGWSAAAIAIGAPAEWSATALRRELDLGYPNPIWEILTDHDPRRFAIDELEKTQAANAQLLMIRRFISEERQVGGETVPLERTKAGAPASREPGEVPAQDEPSRDSAGSKTSETPANQREPSQLALQWLREARASPDPNYLYLAQLAFWGTESGLRFRRHGQDSDELVRQVEMLLALKPSHQQIYDWLTTNPDGPEGQSEQEDTLSVALEKAKDPLEASAAVLETVSDRMAAMTR
jgi:hypothetical protein